VTGSRDGLAVPAALAAAVFVALAFGVAGAWERSGEQVTDLALYRAYGERIAAGDVPYRDFRFEYPPAALPLLVAPALTTSTRDGYRLVFGVLTALAGGIGVLAVAGVRRSLGYPRGETLGVLAALALAPVALGALLLDRFDLVPALVAVVAVAAIARGRDRLGAVLLGLAIAVKLYPAVILPLAVARAWRRGGRREAAVVAALAVGVAIASYVPFAILAPEGVATSIGRQLGRPLQIESLGSAILLGLHQLTGMGLAWSSSNGSQNLNGGGALALAVVLSATQIAALCWIWVRFARAPGDASRFVIAAAASVAAFVALGKVLSPQFLVWLLLLVPLATGLRLRLAGACYAIACVLTALWFPARYWQLVREFDPLASWLVLGRDLSLVALLVVLAAPLARLPGVAATREEGRMDPAPTTAARAHVQARSPSRGPRQGRT